MKYWNDLDRNIFLEKIFSKPVEIGQIALFSMQIENDRPSVGLGFDIPEFPDTLPKKWEGKGYNTCRMGIDCHGIQDLSIKNIPVREVFFVKITKENNQFYFQATNKNALIEFKAKFITLVAPNVYINGPDDYFFR
ncbi:Imm50 family immunity protein [Pseudomonas rhodesiae]|uniref:Imm50 family immunity protein n=1 Tax=Pseudomonas rhodesiae TaxID=76760 RepID=UPI000F481967|nr:Imm50 family immunity protein [Pseudomonas rhodesiae]ROM51096.1 hypothetical protein BK650_20990 [Pseudomonas rhodesiae]ROM66903.1 hypothetical protein BK651_09105 [Pseudomonas rhodesiae]